MPEDTERVSANSPAEVMLWEEARRQLVRQESVLGTLRTQAVAMLSVASIVAGLFGSRVPTSPVPGAEAAVVAALVLFGITAVLAIVIIRPWDWVFSHGLDDDIRTVERGELLKVGDLSYSWAKDFEAWRASNQTKINRLTTCFSWACVLTGAQVIAWGLAILQPRLFPLHSAWGWPSRRLPRHSAARRY